MAQYGETEWDDKGKNDFLKLKDGDNNLRIITKPHKFGTHRVKFPDDPNSKGGGGRMVRCAVNGCVLCAIVKNGDSRPDWAENLEVDKMKSRWYVGVISRDVQPNVVKTLEIGSLIRNKVKEFASNKKWGNPANYDVTIVKDSNADAPVNFYAVTPDPDSRGPMSPEDMKLSETFDVAALTERCKPISNEDIEQAVLRYREWIDAATAEDGSKKNGKAKPTAEKSAPAAAAKKTAPKLVVADGGNEATKEAAEEENDFGFKSNQEA